MNWEDCTHCFYKPAPAGKVGTIIDFVNPNTQRSAINAETLEQVQERYPGAVVMEIAAATAAREAGLLTEPAACTRERFVEALEILPPANWGTFAGVEVFQCCEHLSGRVTATYARIGADYWAWNDIAGTPRRELAEKAARAALKALP